MVIHDTFVTSLYYFVAKHYSEAEKAMSRSNTQQIT